MQIYITTSNGVYKYNPSENVAQKIVVATREKLGTPKADHPSPLR